MSPAPPPVAAHLPLVLPADAAACRVAARRLLGAVATVRALAHTSVRYRAELDQLVQLCRALDEFAAATSDLQLRERRLREAVSARGLQALVFTVRSDDDAARASGAGRPADGGLGCWPEGDAAAENDAGAEGDAGAEDDAGAEGDAGAAPSAVTERDRADAADFAWAAHRLRTQSGRAHALLRRRLRAQDVQP